MPPPSDRATDRASDAPTEPAPEPAPDPADDPAAAADAAAQVDADDVNPLIEQQLFTLFRRTNSVHVHTASGDHELERSTYGILCLLDDEGPLRLGAIAAAYHLDPSTVTRQAQAVVRLGMAEKRRDPADGRASLLALTAEGQEAVRGARAHRRRRLDQLMAEWSTRDRQEFARSLARFNHAISALAEGAADGTDDSL